MSINCGDHDQFLRRLANEENRIRAFARRLLPDWSAVDDVMQESYLVAWRKYPDFTGDEFFRWMCVIVRFEALKYGRTCARSRLVFDNDVMQLLAEAPSPIASNEAYAERLEALQSCIQNLEPSQQRLVLAFYSAGITTKELASQLGATLNSVYKTVRRIRAKLNHCVDQKTRMANG